MTELPLHIKLIP
ncbi:hypothetical protein Zm00014a_026219 [Zea mays]|uniref:Uncharacterized protein n=1 Tax=Zea mays TaxID=4577 RepID=A0A3L6DIJ1_MAIZE|nr:hypothetical protein Zm00014a_026219 [Zea mays]